VEEKDRAHLGLVQEGDGEKSGDQVARDNDLHEVPAAVTRTFLIPMFHTGIP